MNVETKLNIAPSALIRAGYWFATGVLACGFAAATVVLALNALFGPGSDSSDPPGGHSNMQIYTDNLTGCQYLKGTSGGLTPRMGKDGKQLCEGAR